MKLVVVERDSELASALWSAPLDAASSILSYPEGRAALAAAQRGGRLTTSAHAQAQADFDSLHDELLVVGIDGALAHQAGDLAEELGLRGYAAVHLASALSLGADTALVSWDEDLRRAAGRCGCAIAPAN